MRLPSLLQREGKTNFAHLRHKLSATPWSCKARSREQWEESKRKQPCSCLDTGRHFDSLLRVPTKAQNGKRKRFNTFPGLLPRRAFRREAHEASVRTSERLSVSLSRSGVSLREFWSLKPHVHFNLNLNARDWISKNVVRLPHWSRLERAFQKALNCNA